MSDTLTSSPVEGITSTPSVTPETSTQATTQVADPALEAKALAAKLAPKVETPTSNKKKYSIKVDNQDYEEELDLNDDEQVKKHLQMSRASGKRMQEASDIRKAALDFIDQLKKNPKKVLSDPNIGVDIKKFAQDILNEEIAELEKSPEQREKEKLQRELQELKQQAKDREEGLKKSEFDRIQIEQERKLEGEISTALDIGGLPKTPQTVARMAEMMMIALQNNIDLSPKDIAPIVKNNTMKDFKEILNSLNDDQVEEFLGDALKRVRKKSISKMKAGDTANSIKNVTNNRPKETATEVKKQTIKQFLGT